MKILTKSLAAITLLGGVLLSCDNDPISEESQGTAKISLEFESATIEVPENAQEKSITLKLARPALADAAITLKTGGVFENTLGTIPEVEGPMMIVPIKKGDANIAIKLRAVDNLSADGDKVLTLTLQNLPPQFVSGVNNTLTIKIKDDENPGGGLISVANFIEQEVTLEETNTTGIEYQVHFSEAVATDSEVKINIGSLNGSYGTHYLTEPAAEDGSLTLPVASGLRVISFRVKPVSNEETTGELKVSLTIAEVTGSIRKGQKLNQTLTIKDDELFLKPKGYEITAGSTIVKRFFEYDTQGRIARINWETYSPYYTHGSETYFYDASGRLMKINKYPGRDVTYDWSDGRIVKSNVISNGRVESYADYAYDEMGNLAGAASYYRQTDGVFLKGLFTIYLYFSDGNLYKSLTYQESGDPEEPHLISTKTYDNYIDVENLFPMTEVLPGVRMQTKLATSYRLEEGETDMTYEMWYEFRPDGLPAKRIATTAGETQTAVYHYY